MSEQSQSSLLSPLLHIITSATFGRGTVVLPFVVFLLVNRITPKVVVVVFSGTGPAYSGPIR